MAIKAGDLRHPLTLIRPDTTLGEHNRRSTVWTEVFQAHAVNAEDIVTFTIRWRDDIDTTWRVRHGSETYGILEVNHLGYMRDYLRLKCRSVKGGGV